MSICPFVTSLRLKSYHNCACWDHVIFTLGCPKNSRAYSFLWQNFLSLSEVIPPNDCIKERYPLQIRYFTIIVSFSVKKIGDTLTWFGSVYSMHPFPGKTCRRSRPSMSRPTRKHGLGLQRTMPCYTRAVYCRPCQNLNMFCLSV